jgi:transposase
LSGKGVTPGQACDLDGSDLLLPKLTAQTILADKGYDADKRVIEPLIANGKTAVIPSKSNRIAPRDYDKDLYKSRHLIENFFAKLKQYRGMLPSLLRALPHPLLVLLPLNLVVGIFSSLPH